MKKLIFLLVLVPTLVWAQKVDIKDVDGGNEDDTTTIQISKSKKKVSDTVTTSTTTTTSEVDEGEEEIEGEPGNLTSEAKANWKKACADWKKEKKDEHKGSRVVVNCGEKSCTTDAVNKVCKSTGKYKITSKN